MASATPGVLENVLSEVGVFEDVVGGSLDFGVGVRAGGGAIALRGLQFSHDCGVGGGDGLKIGDWRDVYIHECLRH